MTTKQLTEGAKAHARIEKNEYIIDRIQESKTIFIKGRYSGGEELKLTEDETCIVCEILQARIDEDRAFFESL